MMVRRGGAVLLAALIGTSCINIGGAQEIEDENGSALVRAADGQLFLAPEPCATSSLLALQIVDARPGSAERVVLDIRFDPPLEKSGLLISLDPFSSDGLTGITDMVVDDAGLAAAIEADDATLVVNFERWWAYRDVDPIEQRDQFALGDLGPKQALGFDSTLYTDAGNVECLRGFAPFAELFAE